MEEILWARCASLLDAEGSISKGKVQFDIAMCDEDLIVMCKDHMEVTNKISIRVLPSGKTQWRLYVTGKAQVKRCLERMLPYLSIRRTGQVNDMLERIETSTYKYA